MTIALDTDVLVWWMMDGAPRHKAARRLVESQVHRGGKIGLVPQVLHEFVHICTDDRRFPAPMSVIEALRRTRALWTSRDVVHLVPGSGVLLRTVGLMELHSLGRKRILDTALAATLEAAGVRQLATGNGQDYQVFEFLDLIEP